MDSPASTDSLDDSNPPFGCSPIAALLIGGVSYMFLLLLIPGLTAMFVGIGAVYEDPPPEPDPVIPAFVSAVFLTVCGGLALLWPLFRWVRLPHPTATFWFLTATMVVVHLQLFVTKALLDVLVIDVLLPSALVATAFLAFAVPITFVSSSDRGFRWAGAIVVVVVVLRLAMDWASVVEDEQEAFDKVVRTVSEYPDRAALLESEGWSAVEVLNQQDDYFAIDYENPSGERVEITSWADFVNDGPGSPEDIGSADPLGHRCDIERYVCEKVEEAGHTVMLVEERESHSGHLDLLVRLEWLPGVFVEIESWEGADLTELRALVGSLRPVEEGDAVTPAEEVTGGPRR
ncbi:hypothetical protein [Nocardiopsis listeri]|uniref:hypothetical protein n=1 Tax=Nocardiopsis listeri TaxID=53440 RepID=UPI00083248DB|nr:hypothetical protein [Nocardiopsis listeri]